MGFDTGGSKAPVARKQPQKTTVHGVELLDDYAWLRAENWQAVMRDPALLDGEIKNHLEAENAYQASLMADTKSFQVTMLEEMKGRIKQDDSSVPLKDGEWQYGVSYVEGGEQPHFFRQPEKGDKKPTTLLNGDEESEGKAFFKLGGCSHSPDHKLLAWSCDNKGSEYYTVNFRELSTGKDLDNQISNSGGGGVWSKNSSAFFYTELDENHRPSKLFLHDLKKPDEDTLVFEEKDPGFFMSADKSQSGNIIFIDVHDHQTSEVWMIPADSPREIPTLIAKRETGVEYSADEGNGILYILTNRDNAVDFKVVTAPIDQPGLENWQDLVPHESGRLILGHSVYARHLVWLERREGLPRIVVLRLSDGEEHTIAFDEEAYSLGLGGVYEFDTDVIRFTYSSMTTPAQTYDYNMETRERVLLKTQEVPSGHNESDYITRRINAPAGDGELVPVSILYHKNTKIDGTAPLLLYGYGSYGATIPASFSTNRLSLIDRGFVYVIAHVRGGKDKGFRWYDLGRRENKQNTFSDFVSAAEHLIDRGFTSKGQIVAQGGSAGGMLMGTIANMRPDLFAGVIAEVPFVDVLTTMLDDTLPLTPPEWPEWGNPIESREAFDTIRSYSPYDQIKAQDYPPILATAGLTDPRVTYWEPAKWVAKLREYKTDNNPVMLKTNMDAGHAGVSGRFKQLEEVALNYAFALKVSGKDTWFNKFYSD